MISFDVLKIENLPLMKTNVMIMAMVMMGGAINAQQVEIDDMYFTAKDRAVLTALHAPKVKEQSKFLEQSVPLNPTDSYSARNVNPEYISRSKMDPNSQVASAPYFIPNYQPVSVNQQIRNYTGNSYWSNYSSWNNPYNVTYGFNSVNPYSWMYPYNSWGFNNYYYSPWSSWLTMSMGFGYGGWNTWGSPAWGMWNNPYGWNTMSSNWGWNNWGWNPWGNSWAINNYYGYSPTVVIVNSNENSGGVVNGKRVSRSSDYDNQVSYDGRNTNYVDNNGRSRGSNAGGRSDGGNTYYQRGWRSDPTTSGSGIVSGGRSSNSSWWSDSGNTNSNSNDRSWSNSNSRGAGGSGFWNGNSSSGSSFSNGGGGRSGGFTTGGGSGGAGGSSGGSRTRGRD